MAKTCLVVDLPHRHVPCNKGMFFHSLPTFVSLVSIYLYGDSGIIGLAFTFTFFSVALLEGIYLLEIPVLLDLLRMSDMFTNGWFDPS